MLITSYAAAALLANAALAAPPGDKAIVNNRPLQPGRRHFSLAPWWKNPPKEFLAVHKAFRDKEKKSKRAVDEIDELVISTYIHIVTGTKADQIEANNNRLDLQIKALNRAFAPAKITFRIKGKNRVINQNWAMGQDEVNMGKALRKGDKSTLNIVYKQFIPIPILGDSEEVVEEDSAEATLLGKCQLPEYAEQYPYEDFVTALRSTLPGGSRTGDNTGGTTIHETGHFFGLLETFTGGCEGDGDYVEDTPAQAYPDVENLPETCDVTDSCPNANGTDPVRNYMSYTPEKCREEFTRGQITRMHSMWQEYRSNNVPVEPKTKGPKPFRPAIADQSKIRECGKTLFNEYECGTRAFCDFFNSVDWKEIDNSYINSKACLADRQEEK